MENSFNAGYVSEKITTCFIAGTIPIYFGDTTLDNFVNPKSFIHIKPWDNITEKIELIKKIDNDDQLYFSMLKEDLDLDIYMIKTQGQNMQNMVDYIFFKIRMKQEEEAILY